MKPTAAVSFIIGLAVCVCMVHPAPVLDGEKPKDVHKGPAIRLMFGSCNKVDREQQFWDLVLERKPAAWVWMGDNVYADKKRTKWDLPASLMKVWNDPHGIESFLFEPANMTRMRHLYDTQKAHPAYKQLTESTTQILGTWDDHDYGLNDGDARFVHARASQELFLDFLDEPPASPRRKQHGVYWTEELVAAGGSGGGQEQERRVRVILLDVRSHKTPYWSWPFRLEDTREEADFLGEEQWAWLEHTLRHTTADAHVVVSGVQLLPELRWQGENWGRFPAARRRLLRTLLRFNPKGLVVLSGDVHFGELSAARCHPRTRPPPSPHTPHTPETDAHTLLEVTSSGMTHAWGTNGLYGRALLHATMLLMPYRYQVGGGIFDGLNIAQLDLRWPAEGEEEEGGAGGTVRAAILGVDGTPQLQLQLPLHAPRHAPGGGGEGEEEEWECAPMGGPPPAQWEVYLANLLLALLFFSLHLLLPFLAARALLRALAPRGTQKQQQQQGGGGRPKRA